MNKNTNSDVVKVDDDVAVEIDEIAYRLSAIADKIREERAEKLREVAVCSQTPQHVAHIEPSNRYWTAANNRELLDAMEKKEFLPDVAKRMGRSVGALMRHYEILCSCSASGKTVRTRANYTRQEDARIAALPQKFREEDFRELALELGRSPAALQNRWYRLCLAGRGSPNGCATPSQ